jgi:hypothetical protein
MAQGSTRRRKSCKGRSSKQLTQWRSSGDHRRACTAKNACGGKEKPQEQSGLLEEREKKEQTGQEKRLLAWLESLCLAAGRRNSQHEQLQKQK